MPDPEPFLGEIRLFAFDFVPRTWAACDGALLPINQNQALFSLLGTSFGGNGQTNFALPDLRNRIPSHVGPTVGTTPGLRGGASSHTVSIQELPTHLHLLTATTTAADSVVPTGNVLGKVTANAYAPLGPGQALHPGSITSVGGSQAHDNMSPYLALTFAISLVGVFPSFNS